MTTAARTLFAAALLLTAVTAMTVEGFNAGRWETRIEITAE